jgi:hypothetical protein
MSQSIPKLEALEQCAGELTFTSDIRESRGELHAAPLLTTVGNGFIEYVFPSLNG